MSRPLYLDESIWLPVAEGLRARGWRVHTARGQGNLGRLDREQLRFVRERGWLLFTFEDDFLSLVRGEELDHAGLVYTDQSHQRVGDIVQSLDAFPDGLDSEWRGVHYL